MLGEVRHVSHVSGEEAAVAVRCSHRCFADDCAEAVFGFASEHRSRDAVEDLRQEIRGEGFALVKHFGPTRQIVRGRTCFCITRSWRLRPRLYAYTCFAG